jgi:tetrahydrodipicolinate N-succinyltransferase
VGSGVGVTVGVDEGVHVGTGVSVGTTVGVHVGGASVIGVAVGAGVSVGGSSVVGSGVGVTTKIPCVAESEAQATAPTTRRAATPINTSHLQSVISRSITLAPDAEMKNFRLQSYHPTTI